MMLERSDLEIFIQSNPPPPVEETTYSRLFCYDCIRNFADPYQVHRLEAESLETVKDLLVRSDAEIIILIAEEEIVLPSLVYKVLPEIMNDDKWTAFTPVFNLAEVESQRANLLYQYHNIRNFEEVVEILWKKGDRNISSVESGAEWPCLFIRRRQLEQVAADMPLVQLWQEWAEQGRIGQINDLLVHRFGDYYFSDRNDLITLLPDSAVRILDVGCAYGTLGSILKKDHHCHITGVELNPHMAAQAAKHYDKLINSPIEEISFNAPFDAIFCGDVIEHLRDPEKVLKRLRKSLNPDGVLLGSVPNSGHWSIVMDLAGARFEMVPVGLLCMSHIRFFTEIEFRLLLERTGFEVEVMEYDRPGPTPEGERFIATLIASGFGDEDSLRTTELRFRARIMA